MTTQQQVHNMIDNLNLNGLNYIIGVLNGLGADNWENVPVNSSPITEQNSEKRKSTSSKREYFIKLDNLELDIPEGLDADAELAAALEDKYGHID